MFHHPKQCIISQAQPFFFSSSTFFFFWLKEALPGVFYNERRRGKRQLRVAKYISTEKKKKRKTYLNNLERSLLPLNFNNQPYTNGKRKKATQLKKTEKHHHVSMTVRGKTLISVKKGHCQDQNTGTKRENGGFT